MTDAQGRGPEFDMDPAGPGAADPALPERIRHLVRDEPYAILSTQGDGQPYASIVAFAMTDDFRAAVFATPMATRKYRLLTACDRVALLIDNRCKHPDDMMRIEAVTATGRATQVERGDEFDRWARVLAARHPHLGAFVASPSVALFRVEIVRFFHVERFQEVREWRPGA
jgi:nitroimidazol reductase NimA-like FMN-containing flavoprotein (pyridoxamine 5'-phosphate oxidase superfamily)